LLDSPPIIKNNRVLVPIRYIVELLDGTVNWDSAQKKVSIKLGNNIIDPTNSRVVPEIVNGRTMIPIRFVSENLSASVDYDESSKTVTIVFLGG